MKPRRISNQPTYKLRSYKFSSHNYILHKVRNISWIHRSLEHKVITNQVHTETAKANSFKATHTCLVQIQCQEIVISIKSIR
jgi:hypothetical protein